MFEQSFGVPDGGYISPRVTYPVLREAVSQLHAADMAAMERMTDSTLSRGERTAAVGEAEACHDMATDLGSMLIGYDGYDNLNLTLSISRTLHSWCEKSERHLHAHKKPKQEEGTDGALLALLRSLTKEEDEAELPCMAMHKSAAAAFNTWAFKLLNVFADSLITPAA